MGGREYTLVVFSTNGASVLAEADGDCCCLPAITVPLFERSTWHLTDIVRQRWNIPGVVLFSGVSGQQTESSAGYYAVLESQSLYSPLPEDLKWLPMAFALDQLKDSTARQLVQSAYERATASAAASPGAPGGFGSFGRLVEWVQSTLAEDEKLVRFQQFNGYEAFCLVRFETTCRQVWFKAVGEPLVREYFISLKLSELFPGFVPSVMAWQPTCHGWLMNDAGGTELNEAQGVQAWTNVATSLARMQVASIDQTDQLLEAGCGDLRSTSLIKLVDPFIEHVGRLMRAQKSASPAPLSNRELARLGTTLKSAIESLDEAGIPNSLGHGDLSPGNVFVSAEGCTFIDWAEGHVAHPFLTFEYLLSHRNKIQPTLNGCENAIRAAYVGVWCETFPSDQVLEAFLFSPLVAMFAHGVSSDTWRDPETERIPSRASYFRSLARRMKQAAEFLGAEAQSA